MKLLIVEDEDAILMGLSHILDWQMLGIDQVYLASNGESGLAEARSNHPDIVLTDIRMPRMDGITMASRIRQLFPETQIIFLSAYQEIDYYKAAISLKAVNYIEKPVMAADMEKVLLEAISNIQKRELLQQADGIRHTKMRESIAQQLLFPGKELTGEQFAYLEKTGLLTVLENGYLTTVLLWIYQETTNPDKALLHILDKLTPHMAAFHMEILGTRHKHDCLAIHFVSEQPAGFDEHRQTILALFHETLKEVSCYYITIGKLVHGLPAAYTSWQTAAILLQEIFYLPYKSVLFYESQTRGSMNSSMLQQEKENILLAITDRQPENLLSLEEQLVQKLRQTRNILPVNVRSMYSAFFYNLDRQAELLHLSDASPALSQEFWANKIRWANLDNLHQIFLQKTEALLLAVEKNRGQQSVIRQIQTYIDQNYSDNLLSLKEISEYIHMSNSHMCTFYKQETGSTINQYLTQVRMEKAKHLLKTTNYSVSDIAYRTGYRENSYFGRIFKKTYNLTPAEYRVQCKELN